MISTTFAKKWQKEVGDDSKRKVEKLQNGNKVLEGGRHLDIRCRHDRMEIYHVGNGGTSDERECFVGVFGYVSSV